MNDDSLIQDSAERLFAEQVDKRSRERTEAGEFDGALWQRVVDGGFPMLLATERAGGFGESWGTAFSVLRGIGYWQVPLPLSETMIAAQLASLAGLDVPPGPLTLIEQGQANTLRLEGDRLSGEVHGVPWARHASAALVSLADGRVAWLPLG
ncbi:MAG: acyl-CoA dehydrogenase, partial [Cytophagales bacterium]|nr:acyl-CoA dehydrogenase [Rhizobacter sp.]